jgi:hypothetical protein
MPHPVLGILYLFCPFKSLFKTDNSLLLIMKKLTFKESTQLSAVAEGKQLKPGGMTRPDSMHIHTYIHMNIQYIHTLTYIHCQYWGLNSLFVDRVLFLLRKTWTTILLFTLPMYPAWQANTITSAHWLRWGCLMNFLPRLAFTCNPPSQPPMSLVLQTWATGTSSYVYSY